MHRQEASIQRRALCTAAALLLPLLAGCGSGGHSNPSAPAAPASKSGTLVVVASVVSDADPSGNFSTQFTVSLADTGTGAPASAANVQFSTPSGNVSLVEDALTPGTYRAQQNAFAAGQYTLSVARGSDVAAAAVDMPDAHTITSPAAADTLSSNGALDVTWARAAAAQEAWIDTKNWTTGSQSDNGSGKVPKGHNQANSNQCVGVTRRNSSNPAGLAAGSVLRASVRVSVEPVVVN